MILENYENTKFYIREGVKKSVKVGESRRYLTPWNPEDQQKVPKTHIFSFISDKRGEGRVPGVRIEDSLQKVNGRLWRLFFLVFGYSFYLCFFAGEGFTDIKEVYSVLEGQGDDVLVDLAVVAGKGLEAAEGYAGHLGHTGVDNIEVQQ